MKQAIKLLSVLVVSICWIAACTSVEQENSLDDMDNGEPHLMPLNHQAVDASDELLPLPKFSNCQNTNRPILPSKWAATALMQDFTLPFLTFAEFEYDNSAAAFRFSLMTRYDINFDFLVTQDRKLYLIEGGDSPTSCSLVSNKSPFTVPSQSWLDPKAMCVGEAPVLDNNVAWWKTPSDQGANWIWYDSESQLPFRSMYYEDRSIDDPGPIYEHFTFNYFPKFEAVSSTNVPALLNYCQQNASKSKVQSNNIADLEALLAANSYPNPKVDTNSFAKIQSWIPGLSQCASTSDLPPAWPARVQGTVMMTAVSFEPNPFPTRVFYDWNKRAQNTSLYYYPAPTSPNGDEAQVALLTGDTGYIRIQDKTGAVTMCEQALPGPQVPSWKRLDGCECRAQLAPGSPLNPGATTTSVLWCPTDLSANQVFWTWYTSEGAPVVFMQTNSSPTAGTGLNLADYYHWQPGSIAPAGTFDLPNACDGKPKITVPKACHNCHLPTNN